MNKTPKIQNQPLVSVIIITYNGRMYIKKAIESVLRQTYKNIEVIIVNDGSTDETLEIISGFRKTDSRITILTNKINLGCAKTLNKGAIMAHGKYIARLDDDDSWFDRRKLERQICFLEKNCNYVLVGDGVIKIDKKGEEIDRYLFPEKDKDIRKSILLGNLFVHSTVVFRRNIFEKVGGYDEYFDFFADWDLWLKLGKLGKFYNFQKHSTYYLDKEYDSNYSMRDYSIRRELRRNIVLREKYKNNYPYYRKAVLLCWVSYFYSFLPFRRKLYLVLFKLKTLIIGFPAYKK